MASTQDGVITRAQAVACGLADSALRRLVMSGAWQRLDHGVFVMGPAPATWDQWARGALLWAGVPSALGGEAAAYRHGLVERAPELIEVWVPSTATHRGARPRWRLRFDGEERLSRARGHLVVTSVEDTVLDLADVSDTDRTLTVLTRALAVRRTHEVRMRAALAPRSRVRHRALVADVVSTRKGYESALEYRLDVDVLGRHGLPRGRSQATTRAGRVDRLLEEYELVLEADGRAGHEGEGEFRDMDRDNANALCGLRTLRLGWYNVRLRPCATARLVAEVLRQQGWLGTLRPCRHCRDGEC